MNTFHQRCLRRILRIREQHKIINEVVLKRTGYVSHQSAQASLAWSCSEDK